MAAGARPPGRFARRDVAEIVVGACVMAFPAARADVHQILGYSALFDAPAITATLAYPLRRPTWEALQAFVLALRKGCEEFLARKPAALD